MSKDNTGHRVLLLRYLVRSYAVAKDLSTEDLASMRIAEFFKWCATQLKKEVSSEFSCFDYTDPNSLDEPDALFPDKEALKKQLGVSSSDIEEIKALVSEPLESFGLLQVFWPILVLEISKPPEKHRVASIDLTAKVVYDDGTAAEFPMVCVADDREAAIPGQTGTRLTTGVVLSIWLSQMNQLVRTIVKCGGNDGLKELLDQDQQQSILKIFDNCSLPLGCDVIPIDETS